VIRTSSAVLGVNSHVELRELFAAKNYHFFDFGGDFGGDFGHESSANGSLLLTRDVPHARPKPMMVLRCRSRRFRRARSPIAEPNETTRVDRHCYGCVLAIVWVVVVQEEPTIIERHQMRALRRF